MIIFRKIHLRTEPQRGLRPSGPIASNSLPCPGASRSKYKSTAPVFSVSLKCPRQTNVYRDIFLLNLGTHAYGPGRNAVNQKSRVDLFRKLRYLAKMLWDMVTRGWENFRPGQPVP